jgi:hypothetical protein
MFAPIFVIAAADAAVTALIGTGAPGDPVRLFPFGEAPEGVQLPYAVWRNITGGPENQLNSRPKADTFNLQVDIYGASAASVRAVTFALNNALETHGHITRWGRENRDKDTGNYHYDFDIDFIEYR